MLRIALAISLIAAGGTRPDEPTNSGDADRSFVVRCAHLHIGDGTVLDDAFLVVRDGKIESVGTGKPPATAQLRVHDARDKVVMPGIVAADTALSGQRDNAYNVTPDFVAIDGFDFSRKFRTALSGGVTTAYLGTGRTRFVAGQGSVVKLHGDDLVERTISETCALHVTFGEEGTRAPVIFEPTISPTSDDPLGPAKRQYPSARISQMATLRMLFDDAARGESGLRGGKFTENRYEPEPFLRVVKRSMPLRIAAHEATDVLRALEFAKQIGAKLVIENPFELERIADRVASLGAHAIIRVPIALSASNPGGEIRDDDKVRNSPRNAAIAAQAGVTFALTPGRDAELDDYLFIAGVAIRHGLSVEDAMRAITSNAATTLGVGDRVGTLQTGKDADFLVLSGDPFAVGTMVEATYVNGALAFERHADEELLAIRAGTILTASGAAIMDGTILISDGKIRAIGTALALPFGAREIHLPDAVITPGFIDAFTSIGLSGSGGIPDGQLSQLVGEAVQFDDPQFAAARRSGLTTVLVAGRDGRAVSGRLAAIKTGAACGETAVLADIAGLRIVHDVLGANSTEPLEKLIKRGKQYIESWKKYEKALADFKAGKQKAAAEAAETTEEEEEEAEPGEEDPISGTWECELSGLPFPFPVEVMLELKLVGKKVTGKVKVSVQGNELPPSEVQNGRFDDGKLTGSVTVFGQTAEIDATVKDDQLDGSISADGRELEISGTRTSKDAAEEEDEDEDDGPKKPDVDETLEPVRAWIEKRVPAVIRTDRAPAIRAVIEYLNSAELPYVLHGVRDAVETPEVLGTGDAMPAVILGPEIVRRKKGQIVNSAAKLADRGVRLAFATGDTLGTSYLPLHAAHAIRWGLDPEAALHALTIDAARMFQLDDRVGSLERGKDADLVAFSGNPFEMTSRVVLVVCNGRVVVDERTKR